MTPSSVVFSLVMPEMYREIIRKEVHGATYKNIMMFTTNKHFLGGLNKYLYFVWFKGPGNFVMR